MSIARNAYSAGFQEFNVRDQIQASRNSMYATKYEYADTCFHEFYVRDLIRIC